jgi:CubicO group peptidase (beta-lactamase class C family)
MIDHADRMLDWGHMIRAIERTKPVHTPGKRTGYHGLTYGFIVGEILQRVTGTPFPDLVQRELAQPLELDGLFVGTPESELHRAAELIWPRRGTLLDQLPLGFVQQPLAAVARAVSPVVETGLRLVGLDFDLGSIVDALGPRGISGFDFGSPETLRVAIPAGNGLFTARSLARMYAALACGGAIDGVRLVSSRTLRFATERQVEAPGRSVLPIDMRWRLGYHGIFTTRGSPPGAFGHFGFGGSGAWADPTRELAVAMIVNSGMGTPFGDTRIARLSGTALGCTDGRPSARVDDVPSREPARAAAHQAG